MPSVHKDYRGKTPFWIGAYIDEFGRRRKQSTKTEDKREARAIVEGWQRASDLARAGRLTESKAREVVNDILERTGKKADLRPYCPALPARLAQERKRHHFRKRVWQERACRPITPEGPRWPRNLAALSFHSLRHSFNSVLVNAGVPQELRMKLTGHSSADMNAIYSHHELATIRAALDHLPRISRIRE